MNRLAGIMVAAIGLVVAVVSITQIVPGLTGAGVAMILLGGLVIGLSFIDYPQTDGAERMSTPGTLANIFFAPTEVFQNLRRHPRLLVAVLVMSVLSATYSNLFINRLTPERVVNFTTEKMLEMPFLDDTAKAAFRADRDNQIAGFKDPVRVAGTAVVGLATSTFGFAFLALVFFLFAMAMGGKINYWQAFSAAVYATLPFSIIRFVLNTIILFIKDPDEIHPIIGQGSLIQDNLSFLVTPSENPVIYSLLASLSILGFYWLWLNAAGLKNAGEQVTGTVAWSASITVFLAIVLFSVALSFAFPGFIS